MPKPIPLYSRPDAVEYLRDTIKREHLAAEALRIQSREDRCGCSLCVSVYGPITAAPAATATTAPQKALETSQTGHEQADNRVIHPKAHNEPSPGVIHFSPDSLDRALALVKNGSSIRVAARESGISFSRLQRRLKRTNAKPLF